MTTLDILCVSRTSTLRDALAKLDKAGTGILLLIDADGKLERTVTDGDCRRLLLEGVSLDGTIASLPQKTPVVVSEGVDSARALRLMNQHLINHLPMVDSEGRVVQLLARHELDQQILLSTPHLGSYERQFVEEAFKTNWIAPLGPNVDAFEREIADYVGVKHAAAVSSGTAAIHLALRLLDVGPGDVVFCSALTFVASVNPIIYQGARPVFIDSEPDSWNMSPAALERAFADAAQRKQLPKAVIVVNLYGQSADMDPIRALCGRYGAVLVEDAAESLGATYKNKASGSFGRLGIYSFNGNKIITTSGGGMLVSDSEELIVRARFLATQARDPAPHYQHTEVGYNYRMSNILAGVGRGQLRVLDERVTARRLVFQRYKESLAHIEALQWMPEPSWSRSTHWLTACTLDPAHTSLKAIELIQALAAEKIEARPLWKPMQLQPVFADAPYYAHGDGNSVSEQLFQHGICLPSGSNMTEDQQLRVIDIISRSLS